MIFERDEILTGQGKPFSAIHAPHRTPWLGARCCRSTSSPIRSEPISRERWLPVPRPYARPLPALASLGFAAPPTSPEIAMPAGSAGAHALFDEFCGRAWAAIARASADVTALRGPSYLSVAPALWHPVESGRWPAPPPPPCCAAARKARRTLPGYRN
ncbi:hypothetical protein ACU4GD_15630 [Cupriavidus basilensis]